MRHILHEHFIAFCLRFDSTNRGSFARNVVLLRTSLYMQKKQNKSKAFTKKKEHGFSRNISLTFVYSLPTGYLTLPASCTLKTFSCEYILLIIISNNFRARFIVLYVRFAFLLISKFLHFLEKIY